MPKGTQLTQQQIIVDQCFDAEEYFRKVYEAKQNGDAWAKDIPCDSIVYFTMIKDYDKVRRLIDQQKVKFEVAETV